MEKLNKRHRGILEALVRLGGEASMREIAEAADLDTNGVSQSLGSAALSSVIEQVPHEGKWRGGEERYRAIEGNSLLSNDIEQSDQTTISQEGLF